MWTYTYNGAANPTANDEVFSLAMTSDGHVAAVGNAEGGVRARLAKINGSSGSEIWAFMEADNTIIRNLAAVTADGSGNIYAVGFFNNLTTNPITQDIYLLKFSSSSATPTWQIKWNGPANDFEGAGDIALDSAGNPVICGSIRRAATTINDFLTLKFNGSNGVEMWRSILTGTALTPATSTAAALKIDASDNVYVAGFLRNDVSGTADRQAYVVKLNGSSGAKIWDYTKNGSGAAGANSFDRYYSLELANSSVYLAGTITNTTADLLFTRLAQSDGSANWSVSYDHSSGVEAMFNRRHIAVAAADAVYAAGEVSGGTAGIVGRFFPTAVVTTAPEIGVTESGNDVPDGGAFAFGTTTVGTPVTKTFTITNTGDAVLNLSGLTPPSGFTIAQNFGSSTVAASGGTTTFQITMTAAAASTPSGTLTFTNDDANEGTYNFTISGTVNPAPVAVASLTRSNGSPTNASTVNWTLTFAGPVTGLTASNFSLTGAAATGSVVGTPTTSNNIAWGIPVTTGSTDGTLTLNLANATGLSTTISTALPFAGDSYTIDKTAPTVQSVTRLTPLGQNTNATTVTFRVTYSEPVALNAPATSRFQVVPVNGSNIVGTVTGVTGSTNTRDVTVNLTSGTGEFKLRVLD
jgi:hypothetical protein